MSHCAILLAALLAWGSSAAADPVADFYRGKQIKFIIRANPGGNYDFYLRTLARHIVRYIPGNPSALPINMPGGGGLTALNYVTNVAPRDGTIITMATPTLPMDQALGIGKSKVDVRRLNWLGNMSNENEFVVTRRTSATKSLDDAKRRETPMAATGIGGAEVILMSVLNTVLSTRFKAVLGYRSSPEMNLAMERGEAEGRVTSNLQALFSSSTTQVGSQDAADFHVLVQAGVTKAKDYPDVPMMSNLAGNKDDKLILDFVARIMSMARIVAINENVPAERVAALRLAFDQTMKDPEFTADAERQQIDISPIGGEELQEQMRQIVETPVPMLEQIRRAVAPGIAK
jgi:tripartite-type tricarboxylate transporter receptor subunit TctC